MAGAPVHHRSTRRRRPGGIASLVGILREHCEAIEYDLLTLPGDLDLRDLFTGRMSWRRLQVVLNHLPRESAFVTAVRDGMSAEDWQRLDKAAGPVRFGPWSQVEMLLADLRDHVARLVWMNSDGSTPPPDPYPRPGVDLANVRGITPEMESRLAYLREVERLHGAHPTDWPKEAT